MMSNFHFSFMENSENNLFQFPKKEEIYPFRSGKLSMFHV